MTLLTKDEIIQRENWTEEKVDQILCRPYLAKDGVPAWDLSMVSKTENYISFKNFKSKIIYREILEQIEVDVEEHTKTAIDFIKGINLTSNPTNKNSLLNSLQDYDNKDAIVKIKDEFVVDASKTYSVFTDGCFKTVGKESFASCAGWVLENETNTIVAEFTKKISLDKNKTREMPEFELTGISEGMKIVKKLDLKNVRFFTDSIGEARTIYSAILGVGDKRFYSNALLYDDILSGMLETNSFISWVPREFNSHADALTKIPLMDWTKAVQAKVECDYFKEHGYRVNKDIDIFFSGLKNEHFNDAEKANISIASLRCNNQRTGESSNLLCMTNNSDGSIQVLHQQSKADFDEFDLIKEKPKTPNSEYIVNMIKGLRLLKDYPEITLEVNQGMFAIMKNLTPIASSLQEEYFELHKIMKEYPGTLKVKKLDSQKIYKINDAVVELGFGIKRKSKKASKL